MPAGGRAETTRWMLAVNGIAFENVPVTTPDELASLKASGLLPYGQMPLLEIDGLHLSQSSAMIRYLARKGDLYGDCGIDAVNCDMAAGAIADFAETGLQAAFQPDEAAAIGTLEAALAKFGPHFSHQIDRHSHGYIAASRLTLADIVLAEALTGYLEWSPDCLDGWPALARLQAEVVSLPGIRAYLQSPQRWPKSEAGYVVDVARVLQRALPAHMPDADRFVVDSGP